jgi:hypothetical protein
MMLFPRQRFVTRTCALLAALAIIAPIANAQPAAMRLQLQNVPAHGMVAENVNVAPLANGQELRTPRVLTADGKEVPSQFVPDESGSTRGILLLQLPRGGDYDLQLQAGAPLAAPQKIEGAPLTVGNSQVEVTFDARVGGGFPNSIKYLKSGRTVTGFSWADRLYNGVSYSLSNDQNAQLEATSRGALATVVRNRARYLAADGSAPPSQPQAVYTWIFWNAQPLITVKARATQSEAAPWSELHFFEFYFADQLFDHFLGGDPPQSGALKGDQTSKQFSQWGALRQDDDVIAMLGGPSIVYDGHGGYGTYLLFARPHPFTLPWGDTQRDAIAWLWLATDADAQTTLPQMAPQFMAAPQVHVISTAFEKQADALRALAAKQPETQRRETLWRIALARRAFAGDETERAQAWLAGKPPSDTSLHRAGDFALALRRTDSGVRVESLFDLKQDNELLAQRTPALFNIALREKAGAGSTPGAASLFANAGWGKVDIAPESATRPLTITWSQPRAAALRGLSVTATAQPDATSSAWRWDLKIHNENTNWGISRVAFPRLALADEGAATRALYPQGSGVVKTSPSQNSLAYGGDYPSGSTTMQMMAVYHGTAAPHGLYFARHDPRAAIKTISMHADATADAVEMSYDEPAPRMNEAAVDFTLSGQAVWQLLRGDWFDAAQIYKTWAQKNATWWPKLGKEGREDTPLWMRQLSGWTISGWAAGPVPPPVMEVQRNWGVPIGLHWYNWHGNPFDNDYPHYFPPKPDFAEGVKTLQANNVHVMPYINGRLWDTHDKGSEDFEYSRRALPFTTKTEVGGKLVPYTESYNSKESDGSLVKLAAMCPSTPFWQDELRDIVLRLTKDYGTDAVYIDQIAAAAPVLCLDPTHPHPAGGGSWWVEDYNAMLQKIRAALPPNRMLTTEDAAEPYIKSFDGYLVWNWASDGQVPVFPAVYGGAIQMFGRNYATGPDGDKAMRMKVAQSLTWGEQISWATPEIILHELGDAAYMRRAVRLRANLARYFYAGTMARPPFLGDKIPQLTADWQFYGLPVVTTDAAMSGLWKILGERKAALLLANASDAPVEITLDTSKLDLGAGAAKLDLAPAIVDGVEVPALKAGSNKLTLPPRAIYAWNISWPGN